MVYYVGCSVVAVHPYYNRAGVISLFLSLRTSVLFFSPWRRQVLVAPVRARLATLDAGFGWWFLSSEPTRHPTRRFDSRQRLMAGSRPTLKIEHQARRPLALAGGVDGDCRVDFPDLATLEGDGLLDCQTAPTGPACIPQPR